MLLTDIDRALKFKEYASYEMVRASIAKGRRKRGVGLRKKQSNGTVTEFVLNKVSVFQ